MIVWFVTPAYLRYELVAVCLDQRLAVMEELARNGIEARCVVVADDENLDLARARGFSTVERDNKWLGRRFNDGIQYAFQQGAEWIVPIGSDSWIDPAYFLPLPDPEKTRTSAIYAVVKPGRMAELRVPGNGAGPYMLHRSLLGYTLGRPAEDRISRGVDASTIRGIQRSMRRVPRTIDWEQKDLHPYQYIGFRGVPHLSPYDRLLEGWGTGENRQPWKKLAEHYPAELVDRARQALLATTEEAA